jgi:hypothetical protein
MTVGALGMTKEEIVEAMKRVLGTDVDLAFLLQLKDHELKTLLACIREATGK